MSNYAGKNVLIIGGSFGIGEDICREFKDQRANLIVSARSKDKLETLCNEIGAMPVTCDVSDRESLASLYHSVTEKFSHIDIIIFCVGAYQPMNLENFDCQKAKQIMDINLTCFLDFIDIFLPSFQSKKVGYLGIISSVAGYFGMPNSLAYGASKAGLSNLAESLRYEMRRYRTRVQLINPGFVKTRLTDQNSFKMPGIISSQKAAKIILKGVSKTGKFELKFPFGFTFAMRLISLLPYKIRFLIFKNAK